MKFSGKNDLNNIAIDGGVLLLSYHRVDSGGGYVKKNYRNHVYFAGKRLISMDNCQANRNHALGVCGTEDEDGDGLSYLQELDKETFPFDRDSDRDGIPDFYDAFPTNANPVLPLEGAAGFKGSSISEHVEQL